jgi:hypothetical protein
MIVQFPFKNIVVNTLLGFGKGDEIQDWVSDIEGTSIRFGNKSSFERRVELYRNSIPNFENEFLQVISTTNQSTIDYYFDELKENISYLQDSLDVDSILSAVNDWNSDKIKAFNEVAAKKENEYFELPDRSRAHLEKFEKQQTRPFLAALMPGYNISRKDERPVQATNYNFYCVEDKIKLIDPSIVPRYREIISELADEFLSIAVPRTQDYDDDLIKTQVERTIFNKPVVFVEGKLDIKFIERAADLLGKLDILEQVEIRYRDGISGLDKLWRILGEGSWETIPQKKLLLYDCDADKQPQYDDSGLVFRRSIPLIPEHLIQKGIENLLPNAIVQRAEAHKIGFIDVTHTTKRVRGASSVTVNYEINREEKTNFCDWICKNGTANDFARFEYIFQMISQLLISG